MRQSAGLLSGMFLLLGACGSVPATGVRAEPPGFVVQGMVIRNELPYPVTQVMITVPLTGAFAGCGNILPRSECSTTFQEVDYRGNPMVVSWREYGAAQQTDEFVIEPPDPADSGRQLMLEVVVFAPGQAGARLLAVP